MEKTYSVLEENQVKKFKFIIPMNLWIAFLRQLRKMI